MELIDYINPFTNRADQITQISVFCIFGVAVFSIAYLLISYRRFSGFFKQSANSIVDSPKLNDLVFDFKSGLVDFKGVKKTFTGFHNKVSKTALLNIFFNDKVLNSVSNMLVGLGILGTFLGLSKGVSGFVMDSTDTIKESIGSLLGGMGTAFISSIWGMLSSLIFIFIYQLVRHAVAKKTDKFYVAMDQEFLMTEQEREEYHEEQLKRSLQDVVNEYFVQEEDGQMRGPNYYFRELLLNSKNQAQSLSTFADDLAIVLQDVMDQLLDANSVKFKEIIDEKLMPILEQLRAEKEESASGALEGVLNTLQGAMKEMLNEFKESISGETKGEMESLANSLGNVVEALNSMPKEIKGLSNELTDNMNGLANSIKVVVEDINKEQQLSEKIRNEAQDKAHDKLQGVLEKVGEKVGGLLNQQSENTEKLVELLASLDGIVETNNQSIVSFRELITQSKETLENFEVTSKALVESASGLKEGAKAVQENNREVKEAVQTFVAANNESIENIQNLQTDIIRRTTEFLNEFSNMEQGIDTVFENFNNGLDGYTTNLDEALSGSIGKYVESSMSAIDAIKGLTNDLTEAVGELTVVLSKDK